MQASSSIQKSPTASRTQMRTAAILAQARINVFVARVLAEAEQIETRDRSRNRPMWNQLKAIM